VSPKLRILSLFLSLVLVAGLLAALCFGVLRASSGNWHGVWEYRSIFWQGWLTTIWISFVALFLSVLLGLIAAMARRSGFPALRWFAAGYVELIRGTPLLVQLLVLFYVVADAVGLQNRYSAGVIILSVFSGAYIAEIIRSGLASVGRSQLDSARAIGLTRWQTYLHVIFPQAIRHILPPLAGQAASIIKDSSLLSILGIEEFTLAAQQVNSATYSTLESYLPLALGYLALTLPVSILARRLEKRFSYET
jgi:polar amino acid transport system permease protein